MMAFAIQCLILSYVTLVLFPSGVAVPVPGELAPPLVFRDMLNAPDGAKVDWDSLRGHVVVLEFWNTKCAPCIGLIDGLNKLEQRFEGKGVRFISVTRDADDEAVRRLLEKRPIRGWVALDKDGETFRNYGVHAPPQAALIDKEGRLVGFVMPLWLLWHPEILESLQAGERPTGLAASHVVAAPETSSIVSPSTVDVDGAGTEVSENLSLIVIRPTRGVDSSAGGGGRWRELDNANLVDIIEAFWKIPRTQIVIGDGVDRDTQYDVIVTVEHRYGAEMEGIVRDLIQLTLGLRITKEKRSVDAFVMTIPPGTEPSLVPGLSGVVTDDKRGLSAPNPEILKRMQNGEKFFFVMGPISFLTLGLGMSADLVVVNSVTGPYAEDFYTFCVPFDADKDSGQDLLRRLESTYGLKFTQAQKKLDVLIVEHKARL